MQSLRNYSIRRVDYGDFSSDQYGTENPTGDTRSYLTMVDGANDSIHGLESVKSKKTRRSKSNKRNTRGRSSKKSKITRVNDGESALSQKRTNFSPSRRTTRHTKKSALTNKTQDFTRSSFVKKGRSKSRSKSKMSKK